MFATLDGHAEGPVEVPRQHVPLGGAPGAYEVLDSPSNAVLHRDIIDGWFLM